MYYSLPIMDILSLWCDVVLRRNGPQLCSGGELFIEDRSISYSLACFIVAAGFFFLPHILSRLMSMFIISPCCSPHVNSWVISQTRSLSAPSRIINLMYSGVRCPRRWSVQPNVTPSRYGVERQKEQEGEKIPTKACLQPHMTNKEGESVALWGRWVIRCLLVCYMYFV